MEQVELSENDKGNYIVRLLIFQQQDKRHEIAIVFKLEYMYSIYLLTDKTYEMCEFASVLSSLPAMTFLPHPVGLSVGVTVSDSALGVNDLLLAEQRG